MNSTKKIFLTVKGKKLSELLQSLLIVPTDLNTIIIAYWQPLEKFESDSFKIWPFPSLSYPRSVVFHPLESIFYVATQENIFTVDTKGEMLKDKTKKFSEAFNPRLYNLWAMELDVTQSYLYLMDRESFFILDLKSQGSEKFVTTWLLPTNVNNVRSFKVDIDQTLYFTVADDNSIYHYSLKGDKITQYGTQSGGEFKRPFGITLDEQYLYICDSGNSCLKVLDKKMEYQPRTITGGINERFARPYSICIYRDEPYSILYIGEDRDVKIWSTEPKFIQKITGFSSIFGITIMDDILYVCDFYSHRIQLFKREGTE